MKQIKKICVFLLIFSIYLTNVQFVHAESTDTSIDTKIEVLTELQILKGNGVSLDLDSQLSRSEAAAFIVRLLGEEDEVTENKLKYSITKFSDVPKEKWYAPYIGYCVEKGIIDGYTDNTFRPDDKLGEKPFLKLVLTAIGYKYNDDFTWANVFESAYGVGLVKDVSYASGYVEDPNYTRSKVANILFTALQLKHADTKIRMIQKFVDKGIMTKKDAIDYNLIVDELETDIESVASTDSTTIEVKFNEKIQPFTSESILIYESNGDSEVLPVEEITKQDSADTYIITTSEEQKMDVEYTLLIDKMVDLNGNPSSSFSKGFIGYRPDEVESDLFRISKIDAISNNIINVYFTQPINDNALQSAFYSIMQYDDEIVKGDNTNMLVSKLATCDNGIAIYLKNYFFTEEEYIKLDVDGKLASIYGVRLNEGEGDSINFVASVEENEAFKVEDCIPINSHTIQVSFNKEVDQVIAQQVFMYYVTDEDDIPIQITKAEVKTQGNESGRVVWLTITSSIKVNKEYTVLINNMLDVTRQFSIMNKDYTFVGKYYSSESIDVEAVTSLDNNTLLVYVSEPMDQEFAMIESNYQIKGVSDTQYSTIPEAVYYDKKTDPHLLKVYLAEEDALEKSDYYNFKALALKDTLGNHQTTIKTKQFKHSTSKESEIYIKEARYIGDNTIKLSFNKEVAFDINTVLTSNYTLTYTENGLTYNKIPMGVNYINPTTVTLKFDVLDLEKEYKMTFKKLIDYGQNETDNKDGEYSTNIIIGQ